MRVALALICIWVVVEAPCLAATTPARRCAAAKRKLAAKKVVGLTRCDATAVTNGAPVDSNCVTPVRAKLATRWARIEGHGGRATTRDPPASANQIREPHAALAVGHPPAPHNR